MSKGKPLQEILEEHKEYERRNPELVKTNEILRAELKKWKRKARYDDLTGLLRRQTFDSILSKLMDRADRLDQPLAFIIADIDYFKRINDTYGHDAGDKVLQEVSRTIVANVRGTDLITRKAVARYGGEEIVIALPNSDVEGARIVGERIRKAIQALKFEYPELEVTISAGLSQYTPGDETQPEELYKAADKNLYKAKESGRNRIEHG